MRGAVWVVEDDGSLLQGIVTLLESHGIDARGFSDPRSALEEGLREPPAVMITDYAMPALNGVDLARALRTQLGARCPRLVLVTGSQLRRADLTLFDQLVRKPFRFDALLTMIEGYLVTPSSGRRPSSQTRMRRAAAMRRAGGGNE